MGARIILLEEWFTHCPDIVRGQGWRWHGCTMLSSKSPQLILPAIKMCSLLRPYPQFRCRSWIASANTGLNLPLTCWSTNTYTAITLSKTYTFLIAELHYSPMHSLPTPLEAFSAINELVSGVNMPEERDNVDQPQPIDYACGLIEQGVWWPWL